MTIVRPYANSLGVRVEQDAVSGLPLCTLPPGPRVAGDSDMLHGGALAGLLEAAAGTAVEQSLGTTQLEVQPVSINVDYMRKGRVVKTQASAEIVRRGAHIVHVEATAWQDDPQRPIAVARLVFSLRARGSTTQADRSDDADG